MGPANMKMYQLFLWESYEWFPQKNTVTCLKKQDSIIACKTVFYSEIDSKYSKNSFQLMNILPPIIGGHDEITK